MTSTLIYDPVHPPSLFDGRLTVYSTCATCGQIMTVINACDTVHPTCEPQPMTYLESLARGWLSAAKAGDTEAADLTQQEIDRLDAAPPDLAVAAVAYAYDGWPVFPLAATSHKPAIRSAHGACMVCGKLRDQHRGVALKCPGGQQCFEPDPLKDRCKGTCGKAGHGFHDASADPQRIDKWWTKHPRHNIGLATGGPFDVIDIDPKNDGIPAFMTLVDTGRLPDVHGVAVTRSGGLHLYVEPKGGRCHPGIRKGIDYKATGGYVVAAPSVVGHSRYSWLTLPSPVITTVKGKQ